MLVQGVVDCVVRDKDGEYVLIDYKTDYLPNDYDRAVEMLRYMGIGMLVIFVIIGVIILATVAIQRIFSGNIGKQTSDKD